MKARAFQLIAQALLACLLAPAAARAQRDDYLGGTLAPGVLEPHETDLEYRMDMGRGGSGGPWRHEGLVEYGLTNRWMLAGRFAWAREGGQGLDWRSSRLGARLRVLGQEPWPLSLGLAAFVDWRGGVGPRDTAFQPRLTASRYLGNLTLDANLGQSLPASGGGSGALAWLGAHWDVSEVFRFGMEARFDSRRGGAVLVPQLWLGAPDRYSLKAGYSTNTADGGESFLRLELGVGF